MARSASAVECVVRNGSRRDDRELGRVRRRRSAHRAGVRITRHDSRFRAQRRLEQRLEAAAAETPEGDDRSHRPNGAHEMGGAAHYPVKLPWERNKRIQRRGRHYSLSLPNGRVSQGEHVDDHKAGMASAPPGTITRTAAMGTLTHPRASMARLCLGHR